MWAPIAIAVGRWLLTRWIYVVAVAGIAAFSGYWFHKGTEHVENKIEKQTTRIENVWKKIDAAPTDSGIALRRLRQRAN